MAKYIIPPKLNEEKFHWGFRFFELVLCLALFMLFTFGKLFYLNFIVGMLLGVFCRFFPDSKNLVDYIKRKWNYYKEIQKVMQRSYHEH